MIFMLIRCLLHLHVRTRVMFPTCCYISLSPRTKEMFPIGRVQIGDIDSGYSFISQVKGSLFKEHFFKNSIYSIHLLNNNHIQPIIVNILPPHPPNGIWGLYLISWFALIYGQWCSSFVFITLNFTCYFLYFRGECISL